MYIQGKNRVTQKIEQCDAEILKLYPDGNLIADVERVQLIISHDMSRRLKVSHERQQHESAFERTLQTLLTSDEASQVVDTVEMVIDGRLLHTTIEDRVVGHAPT
jgi:hypothetical protein